MDVIDAALSQPIWGTALARHIAGFVGALMLLHLLFGVGAWTLARLSRQAWPNSGNSQRVWTLFWLVTSTIWVFAANAAWFPSSSLGRPYADAVQASWHGVSLFHVVTLAVAGVVAATLVRAAWFALPALRRRANRVVATLAAGAAATAVASLAVPRSPASAQDRPHVILIGIDSLRPDVTGTAGGEELTPEINRFMSTATVFPDTLTPLARTYPAWVSILSGKHPHTTGAVINLLTRDLVDEGDTLPRLLANAGYRTIYAMDEVRFSNIDASYGFGETITPPMGAADFILGFFSDTPLANLFVNTRVGGWSFPYAYANRAVSITYDPDTFIERLDNRLEFDEPTFLAVHLTLIHWPYGWASMPPGPRAADAAATVQRYRRSAARVDQQFGDLLRTLRDHGALDKAIVVVLSDHGESLGEPISIAEDEHAIRHIPFRRRSAGHGTSVFADGQYRVLLAMQSFGAPELPTRAGARLDVPASLEDIAPTLSAALGLAPERPFDGVSWLPQLEGEPIGEHAHRIRFLETELVPRGFDPGSGGMLSESMVRGAAKYYRIDPESDRVQIRAEALEELLGSRQYAATRGGAMLASVPSDDRRAQHLVYIAEGDAAPHWFDAAPTAAVGAPYELWVALQERFAPVRERRVAPP
jgi:arylsulfatase A-like enzyme